MSATEAPRTSRSADARPLSRATRPRRTAPDPAPAGVAAQVAAVLARVADGRLARLPVHLRFWDGSLLPAGAPVPDADGHVLTVVVARRQAVAHLLHAPGQLGVARAWVSGGLQVQGSLDHVMRLRHAVPAPALTARDRALLLAAAVRIAGRRVLLAPPIPDIEFRQEGRLHSLTRDKGAVQHHYDLSNRFYELLLGPSLVYSCAYFAGEGDTLEAAQERKLERICRKLKLAPGERLLDIGCGWGSLAIHAARHHGVSVVGVTLSDAQAELARARVREAGLEDRIEIRVSDYREIADEPFDKIASVGMYEHVGAGELAGYAAVLHDLVRPGGLILNHGITRLHSEGSGPDSFITRYVFPDGELHPVTDVLVALRDQGLEVRDVEGMREHYGLTLRRWVDNLATHRAAAEAEVGEARARVWELYLLGSAQSFEDGETTIYQTLAARPGAPHGLPLSRAELMGS